MLRMSKLTDYGTVVMAHIASHPQRIVKAREIALETSIALPTVSKILKALVRCELVDSYQGAHGGYALSRAAEDISIAQIIAALEGGPIGLTECSTDPGHCEQESSCSLKTSWQKINHVIAEALEGISLREVANVSNQQTVEFRG